MFSGVFRLHHPEHSLYRTMLRNAGHYIVHIQHCGNVGTLNVHLPKHTINHTHSPLLNRFCCSTFNPICFCNNRNQIVLQCHSSPPRYSCIIVQIFFEGLLSSFSSCSIKRFAFPAIIAKGKSPNKYLYPTVSDVSPFSMDSIFAKTLQRFFFAKVLYPRLVKKFL